MGQMIDGKALAAKHEIELRERINKLKGAYLKQEVYPEFSWPRLVSFSNFEDPITHKYTQLKGEKSKQLGILFVVLYTYSGLSLDDLIVAIEKQNSDPKNSGVMVQLPLPEPLSNHTDQIISLIDPDKDVDGLTGQGPYYQATVRGILSIFVDQNIYPNDKVFAVVGSQGMVGKGMVQALKKVGANLIEIDKTKPETDLDDLKQADVIISCTGSQGLIRHEMIKQGSILIDVGLGDFDTLCFEKAAKYTPKTGGVGPMTVISLMENLIDAWEKRIKVS